TSLLRALSGNLRRHRATISGTITLDGRRIGGMSTAEIVRNGVVQVPEGRRVFERMSVEDNLAVGATAARPARGRPGLAEVYAMCPVLAHRRRQPAGLLSGGEQQMLAIGRALMARPRVLMRDEPSLGLAPAVIGVIGEIITRIHAT